MARISTYNIDSSIDGTEFILGTEKDGTTKKIPISTLQTYLATTISPTTVFSTIDVNGGSIDGTAIGASSASTGAFTNITASGTAAITGNTTVGGTLGVTGATSLVNLAVTGTVSFDGAEGTAGQYLKSAGSGSTPVWDTLSLNDLSDVLIEDNSIYVGNDPSSTTSTAQFNIAFGTTALDAITTGDSNIAIGYNALGATTSAGQLVAIGYEAGKSITTTTGKTTLVGYHAGQSITTGSENSAFGHDALETNTTGNYNTAIGAKALKLLNTDGSDIPEYNTAVGAEAGGSATDGDKGTYIGANAGKDITSASNNTFVGALAGTATTTGADNVAVGAEALDTNTTGRRSVAVGYQALYNQNGTANAYNTGVGYKSGFSITTGSQNSFFGYDSGKATITGSQNVGIGADSMSSNETGSDNVSLGYLSLNASIDGSKAVAIGTLALQNQEPSGATDTYNVGVGYNSGNDITTGVQNTVIGALSGDAVTTGSGNTAIGYNTSFSAVGAANQTVIGNSAAGHGDNKITLGNGSVTAIEPGADNSVTLGSATYTFSNVYTQGISSGQDSQDIRFRQFDGNDCARVFDGGATLSDTDMTAVGYGFGYKKPVLSVTADSGDKTVDLTANESGAIIQCDADTNNIVFNLPVIDSANKAGITYTFVCTKAVNASKTITINTSGTDGNDKFFMYGFNGATSITDTVGDTLTIPNSASLGTVVRVTCLGSGDSNAAEVWLAEVFGASAVTNT